MGQRATPRLALMAIQPRYAAGILSGTKQVEFRKRPLAADISTVLIYETAPTQMIVGYFTVGECVTAVPAALWFRFGTVAGIPEKDFAHYYEGHATGVGLTVQDPRRFPRPVPLRGLSPAPAIPQSFVYLGADALTQIRDQQPHEGGPSGAVMSAGQGRSAAKRLLAAVGGSR
jgi:predicted transcriptional regulator